MDHMQIAALLERFLSNLVIIGFVSVQINEKQKPWSILPFGCSIQNTTSNFILMNKSNTENCCHHLQVGTAKEFHCCI